MSPVNIFFTLAKKDKFLPNEKGYGVGHQTFLEILIVNGKCYDVIDTGKYLEPLGRVIRHVNNQAHEVPFALTDYYKYSYFPTTIRVWNILPNERRFFEGIYKLPLIYNIT